MRRLASSHRVVGWVALCAALVLVVGLVLGTVVGQEDEDELQRRLRQLEKEIQDALAQGKPPPPDFLRELQELTTKMAQREAQEEGDWTPFGEDDDWRRVPFTGTIKVHRNVNFTRAQGEDSLSKNETAIMTIKVTGTQEVDVAGKTQLYPLGNINTRVTGREFWKFEDGSLDHRYQLQGNDEIKYDPEDAPQRLITLEVNDRKKLCRLDTPMGNAEGTCTTVLTAPPTIRYTSTGELKTDVAAWFKDGCGRLEDEPYSSGAGMVTGFYQMTGYAVVGPVAVHDGRGAVWPAGDPILLQAGGPGDEMFPVTYTVTWNLFTRDDRPRVVLEPDEDYDTWIPELPEEDEGNTIAVIARIVEPPDVKGTIKFELQDVSEEPGTCLNHPTQNADTDPDLKIPTEKNSEELNVGDDEQSAESKDDVIEARAVIQTKDWGAYGKLQATATLNLGGTDVDVPAVYEATGTAYVTLPKDEDDNSVADEWQKRNNCENVTGDVDDDDQPQGRGPGDGLGVYEEYRGLRVQGQHTRLDPKIKDLFVYDKDGLVADSYLEDITDPLQVHYMTHDEMRMGQPDPGGRRIVNFNNDRYHLVDQHGLYVLSDDRPGPDRYNWGLCHGKVLGPPGTADPYVSVYVEQIGDDIRQTYEENRNAIWDALAPFRPNEAWLQGHIRDATRMTTAHECCHGLGISHHLKTLPPGTTEDEASPTYGWLVCVMRYPWEGTAGGDAPRIKYVDEVIYILQGKFPWGNRLCNTMDDCQSQLVVSDEGY
ncbi:MAG: hypothetical protein ACE5R4_08405 [Armatimonadota bacterium]